MCFIQTKNDFALSLNVTHLDTHTSKHLITAAIAFLHAGDNTSFTTNEILWQVFQEMHSKIVSSVSPDSVMFALLSKKVIDSDDYDRLRHVAGTRDRCRKLLSLLYQSSHPQTFIRLRLALLDEYPWLVDDIDKLLTSQMQQLRLSDFSNGKLVLFLYESM